MSDELNENSLKNQKMEQLIEFLSHPIKALGFEVIYVEIQNHRGKVLRVFIDHLDSHSAAVGIEDCVQVARALDEPLDQANHLEWLFQGASYELEVSSPGVNRPLRALRDFERFSGYEARIHTFRSLTEEEMGNSTHWGKNSKQKNFLGQLEGFKDNQVILKISPGSSVKPLNSNRKKGGNQPKNMTNSEEKESITIPFPLISKANLEPKFNFESCDESE